MASLTLLPFIFNFLANLSVMKDNVLPESQNDVAWVCVSIWAFPPVSHNVCKGRMASPDCDSVFSLLDARLVMPVTLVDTVCNK